MNEIFIGIQWYLTIAYYLWLTSISHATKSFFFLIFSFFFFVPLRQRVFVFLFLFFFPYLFLFFVWIFSNFSILTHTNSLLWSCLYIKFKKKVVYTYNKAQKESLWHKTLFECLLYTFVICIYMYQFCFLLTFSFCVWIFSNFSLKHKLFLKIWICKVYQQRIDVYHFVLNSIIFVCLQKKKKINKLFLFEI